MKQLLGVLLLVGLLVAYWPWVVGLVLIVFGVRTLVRAYPVARQEFLEERAARQQSAAALAARADQQIAWVTAGDPRGIFGDYAPDNTMHPPYMAA